MKSLQPLLALTLVACAVLPCGVARAAGAPADKAAISAKLKAMENQWGDALLQPDHGVGVVSGLLADDFAGVGSKGKMQTKSSRLDEIKKDDKVTASTNDKMQVHVYSSDLATVCGISTEKGTDKDGKAYAHRYGWVDTWMQRGGKWQCIAEAGMLIPDKK